MDTAWRGGAIVMLALSLCLPAGCHTLPKDLEKPRVGLSGIAMKAVGLFEQRFNLLLSVQNPNNTELNLKGLSLELELNDQPFATLVSDQAVTLPRLGTAEITVEASTQLSGWLRQLRHYRHGDSRLLRYRLKGDVFAGPFGIRIPVEEKGEVRLDDLAGGTPPKAQPQDAPKPTHLPNAI